MHYMVSIYGGGTPQELINDLRELADILEQHQDNSYLTGQNIETESLLMKIEDPGRE